MERKAKRNIQPKIESPAADIQGEDRAGLRRDSSTWRGCQSRVTEESFAGNKLRSDDAFGSEPDRIAVDWIMYRQIQKQKYIPK